MSFKRDDFAVFFHACATRIFYLVFPCTVCFPINTLYGQTTKIWSKVVVDCIHFLCFRASYATDLWWKLSFRKSQGCLYSLMSWMKKNYGMTWRPRIYRQQGALRQLRKPSQFWVFVFEDQVSERGKALWFPFPRYPRNISLGYFCETVPFWVLSFGVHCQEESNEINHLCIFRFRWIARVSKT